MIALLLQLGAHFASLGTAEAVFGSYFSLVLPNYFAKLRKSRAIASYCGLAPLLLASIECVLMGLWALLVAPLRGPPLVLAVLPVYEAFRLRPWTRKFLHVCLLAVIAAQPRAKLLLGPALLLEVSTVLHCLFFVIRGAPECPRTVASPIEVVALPRLYLAHRYSLFASWSAFLLASLYFAAV